MKKSLHKVAIAMWVLAVATLSLWGWSVFHFLRSYPMQTLSVGTYVYGAVAAAVLVALGTLIEIADQIRWNALPPDARRRTPLWTYVRRWPHSTGE